MKILWYRKTQTIGFRILLAFFCILILLIIQSTFALYSSNRLVTAQHNAFTRQLTLWMFRDQLSQLRIKVFMLLATLEVSTTETLKTEIEQILTKLIAESQALNIPQELLVNSQTTYQQVIALHLDFRKTEAYDLINSTSREEYDKLYKTLETLNSDIEMMTQETVRQSNQQFVLVAIILFLAGLLLVILWGWYLIRSIAKPIKQAARSAQMIADGNLSLDIRVRRKDETGQLLTAITVMASRLKALLAEIATVIQAIQAGRLDQRGNADAFAGGWRDLIQGLNQVVDAFVAPISVTAQSIDRIAQGEIPDKITTEYQGDFNTIKLNLNSLIDATQTITQLAEELAAGNLDIDVNERSEQDTLMRALNMMVQRLREVVTHVKSASTMISISSKKMSLSAAQMSQGASEQAAATEEASTSLEEMAANIKQNANNARQTEQIAKKTAVDAEEGSQAVTQTGEAMRGIVEKILIIEQIAQETRMLSLNATIEAARASEHGRAFSTVASEVRQLADTTKKAAEEIKQLSNSSVAIADRSREMLRKIVPNSQKTAELVQDISAASSEQSAGVDQINRAISQLDQVTQQNATTAEEVATMAERLTDQAMQLQNAVEFFKIGTTDLQKEENSESLVPATGDIPCERRI
jgi:methyl-accepting chemotaxis protein